MTVTDHRAAAAQAFASEQESFQRSDTDGCVSQWASNLTGRLHLRLAEIAEAGGKAEFSALFTAEGDLIADARYVQTRYGWTWVYDTAEGDTVWFRPSRAQDDDRRISTDRKKGHYVGRILAPASAKVDSPAGARGLGGMTSCFIATYRTTKGTEGVEVIDNGQ